MVIGSVSCKYLVNIIFGFVNIFFVGIRSFTSRARGTSWRISSHDSRAQEDLAIGSGKW